MDVSVLIPFRGDGARRDELFAHVVSLWDKLPVEVAVGTDSGEGPFNISAAFNDAARQATTDTFILFGADHLPDLDRIAWAARHLEQHPWVPLFASTGAYSLANTDAILAGADPARFDFDQWAPFCTAILGVTRQTWADVGGMDERFIGWGGEDTAFRMALEHLYGPAPAPSEALRCLWHPAAPRDHSEANFALIGEYMVAAEAGRMREYLETLKAAA